MRKVLVIRANSLTEKTEQLKLLTLSWRMIFRWVLGMGSWFYCATVRKIQNQNLKTEPSSRKPTSTSNPPGKEIHAIVTLLVDLPVYQLMVIEWDAAHTIQIISLPPVAIAGKIRRNKWFMTYWIPMKTL